MLCEIWLMLQEVNQLYDVYLGEINLFMIPAVQLAID